MARYFFHFRNGETLTPDHHGIEFDSADAALSEACKAAIAMWSELLEQRSEPTQCAFEIADESGNALFVLPFAEVLERCGLRGRPAPQRRLARAVTAAAMPPKGAPTAHW